MFAALAMASDGVAAAQGAGIPLLRTPEWGRPGALQLRLDPGTPGALLMHRAEGAVYRYDPSNGRLALVDAASWEQARSPIAFCDRQYPAKTLRVDPGSGKLLTAAGDTLPLGGRSAVATREAPSGRYAAVLSGSGSASSVAPFLGAGSRGPFHHDAVTLPEGRSIGPSVRLPFGSSVSALVFCWAPDDVYVVYADALLTGVAVVPVNATRGRQ